MEIYTAKIQSGVIITLVVFQNYLFWTCPHGQNHLPTPMALLHYSDSTKVEYNY